MDQEDCAVSKARLLLFFTPLYGTFLEGNRTKNGFCFNLERVFSLTWRIDFVVVKQDGVKMY